MELRVSGSMTLPSYKKNGTSGRNAYSYPITNKQKKDTVTLLNLRTLYLEGKSPDQVPSCIC